MVSLEAVVALQNFLSSFFVFLIIIVANVTYNITSFYINVSIIIPGIIVTFLSTKLVYKGYSFKIAIRSCMLGIAFALGIYVKLVAPPQIQAFGLYLCIMAFFHYSEFLILAIIQPDKVSIETFMLNHSPEYKVAALASCLEFFVEAYYFPEWKQLQIISYFGVFMCIAGETLRKAAIITAGRNFNHLVQSKKAEGHVLVTRGVYAWFRHPSYVGWFYWSLGTQIALLNPICLVGYAVVSWKFFEARIYIEEMTLLGFFGDQYWNYQKKVKSGLPFISGYTG